MITIEVLCSGKNSRLEGDKVVTDVTFAPNQVPYATHSVGANIGVPDVNKGTPAIEEKKSNYSLVSGVFTVKVEDDQADKYKVGETYAVAIGTSKK